MLVAGIRNFAAVHFSLSEIREVTGSSPQTFRVLREIIIEVALAL
jgi:hypothetical protein